MFYDGTPVRHRRIMATPEYNYFVFGIVFTSLYFVLNYRDENFVGIHRFYGYLKL